MTQATPDRATRRVRHDPVRRLLQVVRVERLAPSMVRVVLGGDELAGFTSAGFDDHVKLFIPAPGQPIVLPTPGPDGPVYPAGAVPPAMRDFTPRRHDAAAAELWIDFALHDAGPAAAWAARARPGDTLGVGGPRGSMVIPADFDWHLLIADESALPAVGRRLDELPDHLPCLVVAEVENAAEQIALPARPSVRVIWVYRQGGARTDPARLMAALDAAVFPAGDYHGWIAGESGVARTLRRHLLDTRGANRDWLKAAGYWRQGDVATHDTHTD